MSKNNNVNPGQYKVAGRERPGEDVNVGVEKAQMRQAQVAQAPAPRPAPPKSAPQQDTKDDE